MEENVRGAIERGDKLEDLSAKTGMNASVFIKISRKSHFHEAELETGAQTFQRQATTLKKKMWWKNLKILLIIIVVIILILLAIIRKKPMGLPMRILTAA